MIAPLNCDECKMQYRCTHISADCKYPEGRQYGVTTYDKIRADQRSALEKRLEEAEKMTDDHLKETELLTRRLAILQKGLEEIANNCVLGPSEIGPLHGAGMADGIYIQAKIATQTLKDAEECK